MAGMKRFVTYIYAYENKIKGSNIGFAKIEIRGEDCRIEIHLRGVYAGRSGCAVYLFREDAGDIEGIRIGEMHFAGGNGDFVSAFKAARIAGSPLGIGDVEGICLLCADDRIFMSRWREGTPIVVCREHFRERKPGTGALQAAENVEMVPAGEVFLQKKEEGVPKGKESQAVSEASAVGQDILSSEEAALAAEERVLVGEESIQATELPMRNVFPGYDWATVWAELQNVHPLCSPFADREVVCLQLELKDLKELPRKYWYLGNNSFLLHGFFNYRYLFLGKTSEERWFIGVPGIYQRQERVMAAIFGFPEFIPAEGVNLEEKMRETGEPVNQFGCWYRYIEE